MKLYFAPMEGITDRHFRRLHHKYFGGADRYYTPFFSPTSDGRFPPRDLRDLSAQANAGVPVVPQLLTRHSADFLWAARALSDMGYEEVDLNLGCPSGTVTAKGKGSGLLDKPEELERLLDGIFAHPPCAISVKTRLGRTTDEEFPRLLELFDRYPICELIVHCRVGADFYRKPARPEAFALPLAESKNPVCYNGDLTTVEKYNAFTARYPHASAVMVGRGGVADPALFRRLRGGPAADRATLKAYHDELFETYTQAFGSRRSALGRMKEIWFYQICLFEDTQGVEKKLKKTTDAGEYLALTARIFGECPLRAQGALPAW